LGKDFTPNPKENRTFSIGLPSLEMVEVTDYCETVSGKRTDESGIFDLFYGGLKTAPTIKDCPLCVECKLVETVESGLNETFMGEIKQGALFLD
jgi:flavin reductase (DIM6/NTAB) family NADH-FMN oxidoreductase RutF